MLYLMTQRRHEAEPHIKALVARRRREAVVRGFYLSAKPRTEAPNVLTAVLRAPTSSSRIARLELAILEGTLSWSAALADQSPRRSRNRVRAGRRSQSARRARADDGRDAP